MDTRSNESIQKGVVSMTVTQIFINSTAAAICGPQSELPFLKLFVFKDPQALAQHCLTTCHGRPCPIVIGYATRWGTKNTPCPDR